ncbi:hypothetical protein MSG28_015697 [Choristoneura fumiferana]|uniref:Uncharacterized protein n=1 Tax=Choristoneura fumiferana TaxID=7141 RepID=A0ACC0KB12_CHOFU|nr:hypothetical protein MSG28_015697 [Choristoneura fumiferana]
MADLGLIPGFTLGWALLKTFYGSRLDCGLPFPPPLFSVLGMQLPIELKSAQVVPPSLGSASAPMPIPRIPLGYDSCPSVRVHAADIGSVSLQLGVNVKHNVNIKNFSNLTAFLKRQSDGFKSKKSNVLTSENITQFLNEAPDDRYLATKIALILGVNGACRSTELYNLTKNDVTYHDDVILVKLRDTKTKIDRMFVIKNEYISIMEKYRALRPASATSDKFFLQFRNGKCFNQVIGRHKISTFPKKVAIFLNLANTEMYTGHCFRRTSATLLADAGANLLTMKRHGGWKSEKVVEGYIAESVTNKSHINDAINKRINYSTNVDQPSTSRQESNPQASCSLSSEQPAAAWNKPQTSTFSPTSVSSQPANSPSITNTQHEIQQTNINLPGQRIPCKQCGYILTREVTAGHSSTIVKENKYAHDDPLGHLTAYSADA